MRAPGVGTLLGRRHHGDGIVAAVAAVVHRQAARVCTTCHGIRAGSHHRPMNIATAAEPLSTSEVADPGILIEQIAREHPLTEGLVLLALLKHPSTEQSLVHVAPFPGGLVDPAPDDLN